MHAHIHLAKQMCDFSVIPAVWCYSFKQYNGMLGSIDMNNKGTFEVTVVNRFLKSMHLSDYVRRLEPKIGEAEVAFLHQLAKSPSATTSARLASSDAINIEEIMKDPEDMVSTTGMETLLDSVLQGSSKSVNMAPDYYQCLVDYYRELYNEKILEAASICSSHIQALFVASTTCTNAPSLFAGQVMYYFQHNLKTKVSPHPQVMLPPQLIYSSSQDYPPLFLDESEMEVPQVEEEEHTDAETVTWEGDINQFEVYLTMEQQIEWVEEQLVALLHKWHNLYALTCVETRLSAAPGLDDILFLMRERVRLTQLLNRTFVGRLVEETEGFVNDGRSQLGKRKHDQFD
ncbi:hypothetical protein BDA99DRAFT_566791 [Phascolomyces articulosus]|uniref:Uncharacterized protein n=1 Tax=Phascolomyces articulosus TaxID=60185 RepID=A0AAD5JK06_9FUNG|nr:hypothetical protein BDA99DRAFT_566791 [Phascolomyces articulosus]